MQTKKMLVLLFGALFMYLSGPSYYTRQEAVPQQSEIKNGNQEFWIIFHQCLGHL